MKKIGLFLALVVSLAGAQQRPASVLVDDAAERVVNLDVVKADLRAYYNCTKGCYADEMMRQAERGTDWLRQRAAARKPGERLAIVLDIDETSLSNWPEMTKADFAYDGKAFNAWIESAQAPALPGTLKLFHAARELGYDVIFLTGRSELQRVATEKNLTSAGYKGWAQLLLRTPEEKGMTATAYKSARRKKLIEQGYTLALSAGDQWSDLNGAPEAEMSLKYPNPFYFLP